MSFYELMVKVGEMKKSIAINNTQKLRASKPYAGNDMKPPSTTQMLRAQQARKEVKNPIYGTLP